MVKETGQREHSSTGVVGLAGQAPSAAQPEPSVGGSIGPQAEQWSGPEPNFFIVGAARAGTSSLWKYLRQHPDVFLPSLKEPSFFCTNLPPHGVRTLDAYLALFSEAVDHSAIGEASPDYFTSPESAGLIRERYPHAKIIILLRNPVDRAYSLYRLNCALGVERMPSFERALAREDDRLRSDRFKRKNPYFWKACLYFRSGFTSDNVERFQQAFPREQIHIILLGDLKQRPVETIREVYKFLGVDPLFVPDFDVRNRSEYPLSVTAHYVVCHVWRRYAAARRTRGQLPTGVDRCLEAVVRVNNWLGTRLRSNSVKPATRRNLSALYRKDIQRTASLIGRDLSQWLTPEAM